MFATPLGFSAIRRWWSPSQIKYGGFKFVIHPAIKLTSIDIHFSPCITDNPAHRFTKRNLALHLGFMTPSEGHAAHRRRFFELNSPARYHARSAGRQLRPVFESLERRLCLAAELSYAWATGGSGYDTLGDLERDAAGNLYTTDGDRVIKYAPDRTVIWATNLPDAWNIEIDAEGNVYASGDFFASPLTVASARAATSSAAGAKATPSR